MLVKLERGFFPGGEEKGKNGRFFHKLGIGFETFKLGNFFGRNPEFLGLGFGRTWVIGRLMGG